MKTRLKRLVFFMWREKPCWRLPEEVRLATWLPEQSMSFLIHLLPHPFEFSKSEHFHSELLAVGKFWWIFSASQIKQIQTRRRTFSLNTVSRASRKDEDPALHGWGLAAQCLVGWQAGVSLLGGSRKVLLCSVQWQPLDVIFKIRPKSVFFMSSQVIKEILDKSEESESHSPLAHVCVCTGVPQRHVYGGQRATSCAVLTFHIVLTVLSYLLLCTPGCGHPDTPSPSPIFQ